MRPTFEEVNKYPEQATKKKVNSKVHKSKREGLAWLSGGINMINVDGKSYKVVESLGFQAGYQSKAIDDNGKERIVVKRGGRWSWWTVEDRLGRKSITSDTKPAEDVNECL